MLVELHKMLSLQKRINTIINDENTKQNKILLLRKLFIEENIIVFSDFDDTLSASCSVYYTKIKLLKKGGKYTPENRMKLIKNFKINSEFSSNLGNIVILSRWDNLFLEELFSYYFDFLKSRGIIVVGIVGQTDVFTFSSKEKRLFLPSCAKFIGDVFEDEELRWYEGFVFVEKLSWLQIQILKIKKIFILLWFLFRWT